MTWGVFSRFDGRGKWICLVLGVVGVRALFAIWAFAREHIEYARGAMLRGGKVVDLRYFCAGPINSVAPI
jgi:hypothetical protein